MRGAWRTYCAILERRPLPTKMVTSGTIFFLSANIHHYIDEPPEGTALRRVVGTAAMGTFMHAPVGHWWFGFIERMFPGMHPVRVVAKVFLDQTIGMVRACAPPLRDLFPEIFVRHILLFILAWCNLNVHTFVYTTPLPDVPQY